MASNIKQVMGKGSGIAAFEHCPTEFHFELTHDEMVQALLYPERLSQELAAAGVTGGPFTRIDIDLSEQKRPAVRAATTYCCKSCLSESLC